jgi:hypothetical protein
MKVRLIPGSSRMLIERGMTIATLFLSQNNVLTPSTTLYTVFFGIK